MDLPTSLTNIPKVEPQKTRFLKTLSKIGEILLTVLVTLVMIAFMASYIVLSLLMPTGQTGLIPIP